MNPDTETADDLRSGGGAAQVRDDVPHEQASDEAIPSQHVYDAPQQPTADQRIITRCFAGTVYFEISKQM